MAKTPTGKAKSSKKKAAATANNPSPGIELAGLPDENRIRERAYGIWIEEGRPCGRELVHWQRARHELQSEA